jgi:hypothetical protein
MRGCLTNNYSCESRVEKKPNMGLIPEGSHVYSKKITLNRPQRGRTFSLYLCYATPLGSILLVYLTINIRSLRDQPFIGGFIIERNPLQNSGWFMFSTLDSHYSQITIQNSQFP